MSLESVQDILQRMSIEEKLNSLQSPLANTDANNSLLATVSSSISMPKTMVLDSFFKLHIPKEKVEIAYEYLLEMAQPLGGFNGENTLGGWIDPQTKWWIEEILLLTCFTTWQGLKENLPKVLALAFELGKHINEMAIGLEIGNSNGKVMLILPIDSD